MASPVPLRSSIVLVVEDEPLLRMFAVDMVEDAGFETVEAASAAEAVFILEARPDVGIVFTDIDMPNGMSGLELAASIRHRWPPIEIIVTSGKPFPPLEVLPDRSVFYAKPYRQDLVVETLRRMAARCGDQEDSYRSP